MKKSILTAIAILPLAAMAQQPFSVSGNVKGLKSGDKVYLIYKTETAAVADSTTVTNGAFMFKGNVESPLPANIVINKNISVARPEQGYNLDFLPLYLEPANIKISGSDSLKRAEITGSPINADNKKLKSALKPVTDQLNAINAEFYKLSDEDKKNAVLVGPLRKRYEMASSGFAPVYLEFVKNNPKSYISLTGIRELSADPEFADDAEKAYNALSPELKASKLGKSLAEGFAAKKKTAIGAIAPDFTQNDVNDKPVKLSDLRGKYVLLDFWASWCGPCRKENPNVVAAYNKYKDKNFTIMGVSLDNPGKKDAWLAAIEKDGLTWTNVSDLKGWQNEVAMMYGIRSIPASFLLDPNGKIIGRDLRGEELNKKLEQLLGGASK